MGKKRTCVCLPDVRMSCCAFARLWNEENAQLNKRCCVSLLKGGGSPPLSPADAHSSSLSVGTVNATLLVLPAAPLSIDSEHVSREDTGVSAGTSLRVLLDPERNAGHNYITVVLPG